MKDFVTPTDRNEGFSRATASETKLPPFSISPPHGSTFAARWFYHDEKGEVVGCVSRYDLPAGGKTIRPATLWHALDGEIIWRACGFPDDSPLLNLPSIKASKNDTRILIVEGEKTAVAAQKMLPAALVTTWVGGAKALAKTDFSCLAGRHVTISADVDDAGEQALAQLTSILLTVGVGTLQVLDTAALGKFIFNDGKKVARDDVPKGYDLADAMDEGWTLALLTEAIKSNADIVRAIRVDGREPAAEAEITEADELNNRMGSETGHDSYIYTEKGLTKVTYAPKGRGQELTSKQIYVGGHLSILGKANIAKGQRWSTAVGFNSPDAKPQIVIVAHADLMGDGKAAREQLANSGYEMSTSRDGRAALSEFILTSPTEKIYDIATQFGWSDDSFIFADEVIAPPSKSNDAHNVLFDNRDMAHSFAQSGTFEAWAQYANLAIGNPLMLLFLASAFAGPLLRPLREEAGGWHLYGFSSRGKTTLAWFTSTVWGSGGEEGFVKSWHGTKNGSEGLAYVHNDTFLVLDELGQGDAENLQALIYLFGNGQGKLRATKSGALGASQMCRTMVLSTGEESIADRLKSLSKFGAQTQHKAGVAVRMIDIAAAPADGVGLFENLHGFEDEAKLVEALRVGSSNNYGFAGREFLRKLVKDRKIHAEFCKLEINRFISEVTDIEDDPQTVRCARRFGLAAAAGTLAEQFGVLPFELGTCKLAIAECFERWKLDQTPKASREEQDVIERTRRFLAAHGDNRFDQIIHANQRKNSLDEVEGDVQLLDRPKSIRAGYYKENDDGSRTFYILPAVFEAEICGSLNPQAAGRILRDRGFLLAGEGKRILKNVRVPDVGKPMRLYAVLSSIIGEDD